MGNKTEATILFITLNVLQQIGFKSP